MKRQPKIRLNSELVMSIISEQRWYSRQPSKELTLKPIIYKVPSSSGYKYQRRIIIRSPFGNMCFLRFRGNAPMGIEFTLAEFVNSFYFVNDEKTGTPYFHYYNKR